MEPYYSDSWLTVYQGDCREVMASMEPASVHCVVTSPPYWGLRDYGTATWVGGDDDCDHRIAATGSTQNKANNNREGAPFRGDCGKCGAIREDGQLGLEPTPEEYVHHLVLVFQQVRRVLRDDGTVWLNLGSSYVGGRGGGGSYASERPGWDVMPSAGGTDPSPSLPPGRAPAYGTDGTGLRGSTALGSAYSDLCDGCRAAQSSRTTDTPRPPRVSPLRAEPIGRDTERPGSAPASLDASPPDAPGSTTTQSEPPRPGPCSHCGNCGACLSVLRSSSRDARACGRKTWLNYPTFKPKDMVPIPWMVAIALQADGWYLRSDIIWAKPNPMPESVTDRPTKSHEYLFLLSKRPTYYFDADAVREPHETALHAPGNGHPETWEERRGASASKGMSGHLAEPDRIWGSTLGRNIRSVWTVATAPYPGAHFATFPPKLVEPCVKAGCPPQACSECGAPWERVVEASGGRDWRNDRMVEAGIPGELAGAGAYKRGRSAEPLNDVQTKTTTGWRPTCAHDAPTVPGTVLDPFAGSGTTGMVAQSLGRRAVLIDLNGDYLVQAMKRNVNIPLGLDVA